MPTLQEQCHRGISVHAAWKRDSRDMMPRNVALWRAHYEPRMTRPLSERAGRFALERNQGLV